MGSFIGSSRIEVDTHEALTSSDSGNQQEDADCEFTAKSGYQQYATINRVERVSSPSFLAAEPLESAEYKQDDAEPLGESTGQQSLFAERSPHPAIAIRPASIAMH